MSNLTNVLNGEDKPTIETIVEDYNTGAGKPSIEAIIEGVSYTKTEVYNKTEINAKPTGAKNLILNPRKSIQQRGLTGGKIQVIESTMNVGGNHTLSFTGTATAKVYEFPALLADYPTTIADGNTNTLATNVASGETVSLTAGYYVAIEFSTTDFIVNNFELGDIVTNAEVRHNELELCLPFYEENLSFQTRQFATASSQYTSGTAFFKAKKRIVPSVTTNITASVNWSQSAHNPKIDGVYYLFISAGSDTDGYIYMEVKADSEIFNTTATYKEDRWFI